MSNAGALVPVEMMTAVRRAAASPLARRAAPVIALIAVAATAMLIWTIVAAPANRPIAAGMNDADRAAVVAALEGAGIDHAIDPATGTIGVGGGDYHRARMLLAAQGLPKAAPDGAAALDAMPMGASHAVEGERLRGARETDLARTIEAIDAVERARVHLALAEPSLFVRDTAQPAASVMVTLRGGRTLSEAQVQAIVHLVAASVSGLSPAKVSVVDQAGRLLSRDLSDPVAAEAARQIGVQAAIEGRTRDALARLLTPLAGAEGFTAEVHAELDFDERQATRESFPETGRALRSEATKWTATDASAQGAVGIPGTLSNTPPPASVVTATPPGAASTDPARATRTAEDVTRNYEVGREVSVERRAQGRVRRLTVAVALDASTKRSPADIAQIDALVKSAVGFDATRGDVVTVSPRGFVRAADAGEAWYRAPWLMTAGRNVAAVAAIALFLFGVVRPVWKRQAAAAAARRQEIAGLLESAIGDAPAADVTLDMIEAAPSYAERVAMVRDFVRANPDRAAAVMRSLTAGARTGA